MSQRSHSFRNSRTSRVSDNSMSSRPSFGAAPTSVMSGQPHNIIDLISDDDETPKKSAKPSRPRPKPGDIVDLTLSPSQSPSPPRSRRAASKSDPRGPVPRIRSPLANSPLPQISRDSSPHSPLPQFSRDSSPEEAPHRAQDFLSIKNGSSPQLKASPQSIQNQRKETPPSKRQVPRQDVSNSTPQLESDEDEDDIVPMSQSFQPSPSTPSKQVSSRGLRGSQKSTEFSIGSSSPLIARLQQRRNSLRINDNAKPRSQSPREVMSRRSPSSEHVSHEQPPTLEELEKSLEGFESRLKSDHALGMRWLLQDVREIAADRKSSFFEAPFVHQGTFSPWASKSGVQVRPGDAVGDAPHIDRLDSFVSSQILSYAEADKRRLRPGPASSARREVNGSGV